MDHRKISLFIIIIAEGKERPLMRNNYARFRRSQIGIIMPHPYLSFFGLTGVKSPDVSLTTFNEPPILMIN